MSMNTRYLTEALELASRGLPVFPCDARKAPFVKVGPGFANASTDPVVIKEWWSHWPEALIGTRTGVKHVVLDIDKAAASAGRTAARDKDFRAGAAQGRRHHSRHR
jgi:Bifunctional DNA primase/polymerase, N-terminal